MSTKRCYYEVLEVERTADDGVLKTAFRKLAMKWHPDPQSGRRRQAKPPLQGNQRSLRHPQGSAARGVRPMTGSAMPRSSRARVVAPMALAPISAGRSPTSSKASFRDGLALRQRGSGRERGADLRFNMQITLEEAYKGKTAQVGGCRPRSPAKSAPAPAPRPAPSPRSARPAAAHGKICHSQGFFTLERTCNACHGRGQVIENPCPSCAGSGRMTKERTLSVNIPAGRRGRHPHPSCRRR